MVREALLCIKHICLHQTHLEVPSTIVPYYGTTIVPPCTYLYFLYLLVIPCTGYNVPLSTLLEAPLRALAHKPHLLASLCCHYGSLTPPLVQYFKSNRFLGIGNILNLVWNTSFPCSELPQLACQSTVSLQMLRVMNTSNEHTNVYYTSNGKCIF